MKLKNLQFANQTLGTHKGNLKVDGEGIFETDDTDIIKLLSSQGWTTEEEKKAPKSESKKPEPETPPKKPEPEPEVDLPKSSSDDEEPEKSKKPEPEEKEKPKSRFERSK